MTESVLSSPINVELWYGQGGIGKSTLGAQRAAHIWKREQKKTRVVSADGGGIKAYKPLMDAGVVEYWAVDLWDERSVFHTLDFATKGHWPSDSGTPNSELLPCMREWRPCTECGKDSGAVGLNMVKECISCKKPFGAGVRLPKKVELINGFENVGLVIFEGATAFGNLLMNRLRKVDPAGGYTIKDTDGTNISAPGQQHYGNAQTYLMQYISNTRQIPVKAVVWTALELRGSDDIGKPIYGPAFPGKKLTSMCIPWFTDVIHVDGSPKMAGAAPVRDANGQEVIERKLFLSSHFPADTKPFGFGAKCSAPLAGRMPSMIDFPPTGNTMTRYCDELDAAFKRAQEALLG